MAITKAAPVAKEVDAIPLETLLANASLRLRQGQYMQYKGVAYKCTDATGVLCAGGAKASNDATNKMQVLRAEFKLDRDVMKTALVVATYAGGDCLAGKSTGVDTAGGDNAAAKLAKCVAIALSPTKTLCNAATPRAAGCVW